jgi:hypothetical protein
MYLQSRNLALFCYFYFIIIIIIVAIMVNDESPRFCELLSIFSIKS